MKSEMRSEPVSAVVITTARYEIRVVRKPRVLSADPKEQISIKNIFHLFNKANIFLMIKSPYSIGIP